MKDFYLHRNAYACQTEDGALFMNLESETYFGLGLREASALSNYVLGWPMGSAGDDTASPIDGAELTAAMLQCGLLTEMPNLGKKPDFASVEIRDAIPYRGTIANPPKVAPSDVLNFAYACTRAALELRFVPLTKTVGRIRTRKARHIDGRRIERDADLYGLVRVFRLLTPFVYTAKGVCLFDSLALVEFLSRYELFPTWVIGARTRPFAAHSWVQHDGLVLNEKLESVEEFTPLLAV